MKTILFLLVSTTLFVSCSSKKSVPESSKEKWRNSGSSIVETAIGPLELVPPYSSKSVTKNSKVIAWPSDKLPKAPEGFEVKRFAENLEHPRWTYVAPNNDIFVAESNTKNSANRITLLRDTDMDGEVDEQHVFKEQLNQNLGMLVLDGFFYIANTDGLYRYAYEEGQNQLKGEGEKIVALSASGYNNHWTRNASGIRNPVGMDWNPVTGELWTAVNERDKIGNNLVPDYLTSVQKGGWYGWPYSYYGNINDPRWEDDPHQNLVDRTIVPDVPLGSHTASLGLTFYTDSQFPEKYKNGAFVGQHGSWNRAEFAGYKVVFVPFQNGKPQKPVDFLTGFIADEAAGEVYGRPVGVAVAPDGSLLVNDDDGGVIWRVSTIE